MASRPEPAPSGSAPLAAPAVAAAGSGAGTSAEGSLVGQRVGKYEIVRVIGRGGMGTVYEALNTTIGKRVAMKFVDAETARSKDASARFQREAEAASAVESAHIVDIFDSGYSDEGQPYIVMELLRGEDLGYRIKRCGRLELGEAIHVTAQILRGLHRAHEAGIVHRDLKPDNIFLVDRDDDPNFAKILDFGISKIQRSGSTPLSTLTRQGTVLGTPFYMSPEQAQAMPDIDGRSDLWSAGAILFECLTGRPPYNGATYEQVIVNICMHDADDVRVHNPAVPEALAQVIAHALRRDRAERFASARAFLDALKSAAGGLWSSRPGQLLVDDSLSGELRAIPRPMGSDPRLGSGAGSGRRPVASAHEPSPDAKLAGTSKVGWSTSRREAARRDKRTFVVVAVSALLAGIVGAFLFVRSRSLQGQVAAAPAANVELSVQLQANVSGARYSVDGTELPGGVLRGRKGDVKRVRVEAEGYAPSELEVTLAPQQAPLHIVLTSPESRTSPVVAPVASAQAASSATPVASADTADGAQPKGRPGPKLPRFPVKPAASAAKPPEMAVLPPPPPPPPPAPPATGVGGNQLKLKTD
jgi:serine/threonine protein kinase